jgi:hypothetical protein
MAICPAPPNASVAIGTYLQRRITMRPGCLARPGMNGNRCRTMARFDYGLFLVTLTPDPSPIWLPPASRGEEPPAREKGRERGGILVPKTQDPRPKTHNRKPKTQDLPTAQSLRIAVLDDPA